MSKTFQKIQWKSGHVYKFKYSSWRNDPEPVIILIYAISGTHPNTGHEHTYFQGINFSYIPRPQRREFAKKWMREWQLTNGNVEFTWQKVLQEYPNLSSAVRRYFYSPNYYISNAMEVPLEDMEDVIVSTWSKDFSKKIKSSLINKYKQVVKNSGFLSGMFGKK